MFTRWRGFTSLETDLQDKQCTYDVMLRYFRATIVAVENQQAFNNLSVYF
jgi:hypothetical protein